MSTGNLLDNKKILIVDDEPDILETLEELLPMCDITKASAFEEANEKNVIVVMLTAQALDAENLSRSYKEGAASYLPKDKMTNITTYLNDILEAKEKGKSFWWRWLNRLEDYFDDKFGPDWQEKHQIKIR